MEKLEIASLVLIFATIPFIISIFKAIAPSSRPKNIYDYFLYEGKLKPKDFLTTSVGYSLQVAAIFLFFYWFFAYGFRALFVPIAWFLGYLLIYYLIKFNYLKSFLEDERKTILTIHGYVGEKVTYGRKPLILMLALTTIIGIGGTMIVEIDYSINFVMSAAGINLNDNSSILLIAQISVLVFCSCYVLWGGYRAVIETDKIQVKLSYILFGGIIYATAFHEYQKQNNSAFLYLSIISSLIFGLFYYLRYRISKNLSSIDNDTQADLWDKIILWPFILAGIVAGFILYLDQHTLSTDAGLLFLPTVETTWGFGILGAISLTVTNIMWQLVDISSIQRLQSIEFKNNTTDQNKNNILFGILATGFESAGIWFLVIILAAIISLSGVNVNAEVYDVVSEYFINNTFLSGMLLPFFVLVVVTFMLSTVDGFVSSISYVSYYDLFQAHGKEIEKKSQSGDLGHARIISIAMIVLIYIGYLVLKVQVQKDTISSILYAIYAFQASVFVPIVISLFRPRYLYPIAAILSITFGWYAAIWSVTNQPPFSIISEASWYLIPPLAVLVVTCSVYFITAFIEQKLLNRVKKWKLRV